jgi:hypothetical protein
MLFDYLPNIMTWSTKDSALSFGLIEDKTKVIQNFQ